MLMIQLKLIRITDCQQRITCKPVGRYTFKLPVWLTHTHTNTQIIYVHPFEWKHCLLRGNTNKRLHNQVIMQRK